MKRISIQTRVFFLALIPSLIISLLLGIYLISSRVYDLKNELRLRGEIILNHVINSGGYNNIKENRRALQDLTNIFLAEKDLQSISFFGPKHELLAYRGIHDPQSQEYLKKINFNDHALTFMENKDSIIFTAPIIVNRLNLAANPSHIELKTSNQVSHKFVTGWVTISMSRTKTLLKEYQVILFTTIILFIGIFISILLARRTSKNLTQPLLVMRSVVNKLEQGLLDTRININSYGEINELIYGINKMAEALQEGQNELMENVDRATADLQQSLEIIEKKNIELAYAQKETLEASRIKSEFIANMSHEIRTPMNSMIGFTNLLLETDLTGLQRNYLITIQKSTINLLNLVNNILDFSRLDAGQLHLESVTFDIYDCIEEVVALMVPAANAKLLELSTLIDEDVPRRIVADPHRLKQVLVNLAGNAIKFTEEGDVTIHVTLDKQMLPLVRIRVAITDTGIGLNQNDQQFIFSAFQQANKNIARRYGGTGLGLAICKKLIDQMGGKIGLESLKDKGSTFWFTFTAEKAPLDSILNKENFYFYNINALLFEPHPISCKTLAQHLISWKIKVSTPSNLEELISIFDEKKIPDFIILSFNLKETAHNSANLLAEIKQIYSGPIIVLINSSEKSAIEFYLSKGATFCLTKPISRINLYHAIFQIINPSHPTPALTTQATSSLLLTGKTILCVDDNLHNANLIYAMLQFTQAKVFVAHSGQEAVELCNKQRFDLILMDLRMPEMDGYETLKCIHTTQNPNYNTPIIALSAHISDDESYELARVGFNDYIVKPISKLNLIKIIQKWVMAKPIQDSSISFTPVIDWKLGLKLANNQQKLAEDMLTLLRKDLTQDFSEIKEAYDFQDYPHLLQLVHKLHGAVCYCGVPRLKNAIAAFESALKENEVSLLPLLFNKFEVEVLEVLKYDSTFVSNQDA